MHDFLIISVIIINKRYRINAIIKSELTTS